MTITELPWYDSMNSVRGARKQANPNFGFQRQLQNFEYTSVKNVFRLLLFYLMIFVSDYFFKGKNKLVP